MKAPIKTTESDRPTALDTLTNICELAIEYRYQKKPPSLADLVRLTGAASRALRYDNVDEKITIENAVVMELAKKRGLVS